jgi:hypothetical protein
MSGPPIAAEAAQRERRARETFDFLDEFIENEHFLILICRLLVELFRRVADVTHNLPFHSGIGKRRRRNSARPFDHSDQVVIDIASLLSERKRL